jgi:hypothetical protein
MYISVYGISFVNTALSFDGVANANSKSCAKIVKVGQIVIRIVHKGSAPFNWVKIVQIWSHLLFRSIKSIQNYQTKKHGLEAGQKPLLFVFTVPTHTDL